MALWECRRRPYDYCRLAGRWAGSGWRRMIAAVSSHPIQPVAAKAQKAPSPKPPTCPALLCSQTTALLSRPCAHTAGHAEPMRSRSALSANDANAMLSSAAAIARPDMASVVA